MSNMDYPIELRFEGYKIMDAGFAPIPIMLLRNYIRLGLSDGHFALISHILSYKWTDQPSYPTLTGLRMSTKIDTRRKYVREMRNLGLLFTRRKYWTKEDAKEFVQAKPGKVRSNEWYLGSLFFNIEQLHQWVEIDHRDPKDYTIIIPDETLKLFAADHFHDIPDHIILLCKKSIVERNLLWKNSTVDPLLWKKLVLENSIVMKEESESKKKDNNNEDSDSVILGLDELVNHIVDYFQAITKRNSKSIIESQKWSSECEEILERCGHDPDLTEEMIDFAVEVADKSENFIILSPLSLYTTIDIELAKRERQARRQEEDGWVTSLDTEMDLEPVEPDPDAEFWERILDQLRLQMTQETFNRWLIHTRLIERTQTQLTIEVTDEFAQEWLANRLYNTIRRTVNDISGHDDLNLVFVLPEASISPSVNGGS